MRARVDAVDRREARHVGEEDRGLDDVRERRAGGLEDRREVVEDLLGLRRRCRPRRARGAPGSSGTWPATKTRPLATIAWLYGAPQTGAGALGVLTADFDTVLLLRAVAARIVATARSRPPALLPRGPRSEAAARATARRGGACARRPGATACRAELARHAGAARLRPGRRGRLLFGIPLLYTMELWFTGLSISAFHAVLLVVLSLVLALAFVLVIGFRGEERPDVAGPRGRGGRRRRHRASSSPRHAARAGTHRARSDDLDVVAGRIAIELVPVTLGVSIANQLLPRGGGARTRRRATARAERRVNPTLLDLFAAGAGALLLSLNIAPTDEVRMIAGELGESRLVAARPVLACWSATWSCSSRRSATSTRPASDRGRAAAPADGDRRLVRGRAARLRARDVARGRLPRRPVARRVLAQVVVLGLPGGRRGSGGGLAVWRCDGGRRRRTQQRRSAAEMVTTAICVLLIALRLRRDPLRGLRRRRRRPGARRGHGRRRARPSSAASSGTCRSRSRTSATRPIEEIGVVVECADGSGRPSSRARRRCNCSASRSASTRPPCSRPTRGRTRLTGRVRSFQIAEDV